MDVRPPPPAEDPNPRNGAGLPDEQESEPDNPQDREQGCRVGEYPRADAAVIGEVETAARGSEHLGHGVDGGLLI